MIGGAPFLMSPLESALLNNGIEPVYAFSTRESVEKKLPDGSVQKTNIFKHKGFVPPIMGATAKFIGNDGRDWYELNGVDYGTEIEFNGAVYAVTEDDTILDDGGYPLTEGDWETIAVRQHVIPSRQEN